MKGIVVLNKPKNWTSRDAVNKVRNILHTREIGHMGTLDPQGEGVLLIGVGKATRLFDAMLKKDKVYRAHFTFSYETDTLDGDGVIIKDGGTVPTLEEIDRIIPSLLGKVDQIPPLYSAKNINGERAYDLARRGVEFTLKSAKVEIFSIKVIQQTSHNTFYFEIHCSAGTYIRSICRDIAYALGTYATMTSITRIRAGKFSIEQALTIEEVKKLEEKALIPLEDALIDYPKYCVDSSLYTKLSNGVKLKINDAPEGLFTVYCNDELFGLGSIVDGILKIGTYLKD